VRIKVLNPYPQEFEEKVEASNPGLAAKRAYKKVRKTDLPRKKINRWDFTVIKL